MSQKRSAGEAKDDNPTPTKKQKTTEGSSSSSTAAPAQLVASTLSIQSLHLKDDSVTVINAGTEPVVLTGWKLESSVGNQTYTFPEGFSLAQGTTVSVWSGKDATRLRNHPPSSLAWTNKYIWNDKGDSVRLLNPAGELADQLDEAPIAPSPHIILARMHLKKEYVTVENHGGDTQDISGWLLRSITGAQSFTFPAGTVLPPGTSSTVWSGRNSDAKQNPPHAYSWTKRNVWNDTGDTAVLYNSEGDLVDQKQEWPEKIPQHIERASTSTS